MYGYCHILTFCIIKLRFLGKDTVNLWEIHWFNKNENGFLARTIVFCVLDMANVSVENASVSH